MDVQLTDFAPNVPMIGTNSTIPVSDPEAGVYSKSTADSLASHRIASHLISSANLGSTTF
jgi:hypothetical protein